MNNTIFDDVFRTMIEKMPRLAVPLINEVFNASYPPDVKIIQLRNEHQDESGEIISDSCLCILENTYHIECESSDDSSMAIRMIQYDFRIGMEAAHREGRLYRMTFPKSCVLYLRHSSKTPDFLEVHVTLPDDSDFLYRIPTVKLGSYTMDDMFDRDLQMLLPFYVLRYERLGQTLADNPEALHSLMDEYAAIRRHLERKFFENGRPGLYTDLIKLIVKIADYIFRDSDRVKKGIGDVMGGKILQLESERLRAEGLERGIAQGIEQGIERGIAALVMDYLDEGFSRERILEKLQFRFSLDRDAAECYFERFSKMDVGANLFD